MMMICEYRRFFTKKKETKKREGCGICTYGGAGGGGVLSLLLLLRCGLHTHIYIYIYIHTTPLCCVVTMMMMETKYRDDNKKM